MAKKPKRRQSRLHWYYQNEWWRSRRLVHLEKFPTCFICDTKKRLHVHHRLYTTMWAEREEDLVTLCEHHHTQVEEGVSNGWWTRLDGHTELKRGGFPVGRPKKKKRKNRGPKKGGETSRERTARLRIQIVAVLSVSIKPMRYLELAAQFPEEPTWRVTTITNWLVAHGRVLETPVPAGGKRMVLSVAPPSHAKSASMVGPRTTGYKGWRRRNKA